MSAIHRTQSSKEHSSEDYCNPRRDGQFSLRSDSFRRQRKEAYDKNFISKRQNAYITLGNCLAVVVNFS